MCSINGAYAKNGKLNTNCVNQAKQMFDLLKQRGPDEKGEFLNTNCYLASNRFSITGRKNGKMPISNESGTIQLVLNGEIYNYLKLKSDLIKKGHKFNTLSDAEAIIHLYEENKGNVLQKLKGMFAFALYDNTNPNSPKLVLARDRFGEKPLFYTENEVVIYFASESNALLNVTAKKVSTDALAQYLALGFCIDHLIEGIKRVKSGEYLIIDKKGSRTITYWKPAFKTNYNISYKNAADKAGKLLKKAVEIMIPKEVKYGLFLSGGIDSSTIGAQLNSISKHPDAFCAGLKNFENFIPNTNAELDFRNVEDKGNEFEYAQVLAQNNPTVILHKREFTADEFSNCLSRMIRYLPGGPVCSTSFPIWYFAAEKAHEQRTKVVLSGEGADEVFGGYLSNNPNSYTGREDTITRFSEIMNWFNINELSELIKGEFVDPFKTAQKHLGSNFSGEGEKQDVEFNKLRFLVGHGLVIAPHMLEKADGMTMIYPLEARMPFLYPDLVEFLYTLPAKYFISSRGTKLLLRTIATKAGVPNEIISRPKQRTSLPFTKLFYKDKKFSKKFQGMLLNKDALIKNYLHAEKVDEIVKNSENNPRRMLSLIILEKYLEYLQNK